jgi:tRNA threonylcarbamoyl adenosine modification protein YeaZ/ribosomal-protein-alanine acetyltransferase
MMKIIAIDSSSLVASVAIATDKEVMAEYTVNYKKTHSQTLLPMLEEICNMTELNLEDVDAIAIANGPGSFTGLRIGAATAKGLGLALNKPIIPVPTTDALAFNMYGHNGLICPIMDARRNQVYTGLYGYISTGGECYTCDSKENYYEFIRIKETSAMSIEELCELINERHEEVIFLGDGVPVYKEQIDKLLKMPYMFAPAHLSRQHAGSVGRLGMELFAAGKYESAAEHSPKYYRVSQAERERKEKAIMRPMKPEDLEIVSEMENASYTDPWSKAGFEDGLKDNNYLSVVMEDTTGVVGYAVAVLSGEEADLVKITIDEKERAKGYGRKLLELIMAELHNRGARNVTLEVRASNEPAIALYEHAGFVSEGVRPGFYSNPKEDAVIYWLRR